MHIKHVWAEDDSSLSCPLRLSVPLHFPHAPSSPNYKIKYPFFHCFFKVFWILLKRPFPYQTPDCILFPWQCCSPASKRCPLSRTFQWVTCHSQPECLVVLQVGNGSFFLCLVPIWILILCVFLLVLSFLLEKRALCLHCLPWNVLKTLPKVTINNIGVKDQPQKWWICCRLPGPGLSRSCPFLSVLLGVPVPMSCCLLSLLLAALRQALRFVLGLTVPLILVFH